MPLEAPSLQPASPHDEMWEGDVLRLTSGFFSNGLWSPLPTNKDHAMMTGVISVLSGHPVDTCPI